MKDFMQEYGSTIITLIVIIGVIVGVFQLLRAISRGLRNAKSNRKMKREKKYGTTREIIDSIGPYLVKNYGFTLNPADDEGDQRACYRNLTGNRQLFVTWYLAPYLNLDTKLHGRSSRTINTVSDIVSLRISLLGGGGHWQEELNWGAVERNSWNGEPRGLHSQPLDQKIKKALKKFDK